MKRVFIPLLFISGFAFADFVLTIDPGPWAASRASSAAHPRIETVILEAGESGFMIWADLQGMAQLGQTQAHREAQKQFEALLVQYDQLVAQAWNEVPLPLGGELEIEIPVPEIRFFDDLKQDLQKSGFQPNIRNQDGYALANRLLSTYQAKESQYLQKSLDLGRKSTSRLNQATIDSITQFARQEMALNLPREPGSAASPVVVVGGGDRSVTMSDFLRRLDQARVRVDQIEAHSPQQATLKGLAQTSLREAESEARGGRADEANEYLDMALTIADIAVGLDPVSGFYRSLAEVASGYNIITTKPLNDFERGLAVAGVLSGGAVPMVSKALRLISKSRVAQPVLAKGLQLASSLKGLSNKAMESLRRTAYGLKPGASELIMLAMTRHLHNFEIEEFLSASEASEIYLKRAADRFVQGVHRSSLSSAEKIKEIDRVGKKLEAPFRHSVPTNLVRTKNATILYQVRSASSLAPGPWLISEETVKLLKGKTPEEVRRMLSLPNKTPSGRLVSPPSEVIRVEVPAGKQLLSGEIASAFKGDEGLHQLYYLDAVEELSSKGAVPGVITGGGK